MNTLITVGSLAFFVGILLSYLVARIRQERFLTEIARLRAEKEQLSAEWKQNLTQEKLEWERRSQSAFDTNAAKLEETNQKSLAQLLNPLKERIMDFEKKVQETYNAESRERFALKQEIEKICLVNSQMQTETRNLTRALKGDVKAQGNWGEIILEKLLHAAGLRQGIEFSVQGKTMNLRGEDGKSLRPDVIINLPDEKHIIVDSKVSLLSYERYTNEENEELKLLHLKEFKNSLYAHIDGLSGKHYQDIKKLHSPDFVFLFMPIESAFLTANQCDREIFSYAWERKIIIVGPSTLLPSLRTVASLWKSELQNRYSLEIAQQGGRLYDKFVSFVDSMLKVGKGIEDAQRQYHEAMSRLKEGKGNLIRQAERLQELGVRSQKKLPAEVTANENELPEPSTPNENIPI